jgi:hypothetical protein
MKMKKWLLKMSINGDLLKIFENSWLTSLILISYTAPSTTVA